MPADVIVLGSQHATPDVGAVVHGHPLHATALAATGARLEMLSHDAVLFAESYDERNRNHAHVSLRIRETINLPQRFASSVVCSSIE